MIHVGKAAGRVLSFSSRLTLNWNVYQCTKLYSFYCAIFEQITPHWIISWIYSRGNAASALLSVSHGQVAVVFAVGFQDFPLDLRSVGFPHDLRSRPRLYFACRLR